jgi:hypothetical protein
LPPRLCCFWESQVGFCGHLQSSQAERPKELLWCHAEAKETGACYLDPKQDRSDDD